MQGATLTIAKAKDLIDSLIESLEVNGSNKDRYKVDFGFQISQVSELSKPQAATLLRKAKHALGEFQDDYNVNMSLGAGVHNDAEALLVQKTREIHAAKQEKARPKIEEIPKGLIVPKQLADAAAKSKAAETKGEDKPVALVDTNGAPLKKAAVRRSSK